MRKVRLKNSSFELFVHNLGELVSDALVEAQVWEPYETRLLSEYLHPGDVFVDVGANIGYYTLIASGMVGDQGDVWAFEPNPDNFALLRKNVDHNMINCCHYFPFGLGATTSQLQLCSPAENMGDSHITAEGTVPSGSMVDIRPGDLLDIPHIDVLKVDTQGYELEVLRGLTETIARSENITIFLEYWPWGLARSGFDYADLLAELGALNMDLFQIDHVGECLVPVTLDVLRGQSEAWLQNQGFVNLLLTRS